MILWSTLLKLVLETEFAAPAPKFANGPPFPNPMLIPLLRTGSCSPERAPSTTAAGASSAPLAGTAGGAAPGALPALAGAPGAASAPKLNMLDTFPVPCCVNPPRLPCGTMRTSWPRPLCCPTAVGCDSSTRGCCETLGMVFGSILSKIWTSHLGDSSQKRKGQKVRKTASTSQI